MSLGSVRLDPVVADVVSFFGEKYANEFALSSPNGRSIAMYYRVFARNIVELRIELESDKIKLSYYNDNEDRERKSVECERVEIGKIVNFLSTCSSIQSLSWSQLAINDSIIKQLLHIGIGKISIGYSRIEGNAMLFVRFLQKSPLSIETISVELSNDVVNNNNIKLLLKVDIHCSLDREKQAFQHRITTVSDEFLRFNWENGTKKFVFSGFITRFTIKEIEEYLKSGFNKSDFGILGCDQLSDAIAFKNSRRDSAIKLYSLNGQKALAFKIYSDDRKEREYNSRMEDYDKFYAAFCVSLDENCHGSVNDFQVPTDVVSVQTLDCFEKSVQVLNSTSSEDYVEATQQNMNMVSISYLKHYKSSTRLKIKYSGQDDSMSVRLVKTDLDEEEASSLVTKFLKTCRSIFHIAWDGMEMLKEHIEILAVMLGYMPYYCSITINSDRQNDWLTDAWLISFFNSGNLPTNFSAQNCQTFFTAHGIKNALKVLETRNVTVLQYDLGTIRNDNIKEVEKFVEEMESDTEGQWTVEKERNDFADAFGDIGPTYWFIIDISRKVNETDNIMIRFDYPDVPANDIAANELVQGCVLC